MLEYECMEANMFYILALVIFVLCSILMYFCLPKFKSIKVTNIVFVLLIVIPYYIELMYTYLRVGAKDWNFLNMLPIANVSPFMFAVIPLFFLFPTRIRKYLLLIIPLISVGMIMSPVLSCIYFASINYKFHISFCLGYLSHFAVALWGLYLVYTKQVELKVRDSLISGSLLIGVALVMLVLNLIFKTAFFGLSLYGNHNIYNMVLVSNSYLSALIYFLGLMLVLVTSYCLHLLVNKIRNQSLKA